jgi:hypothetical protein
MKFIRSPLVHFLLFGLLIFTMQLWRSLDREKLAQTPSLSIRIEIEKLEELKATFEKQTGRRPNSKEFEFMLSAEIDDEILVREALARGFLEQDGGIQARLIQKMIFLESESSMEDAKALLARAISLNLHRDDIVVRRILIQKMRLHVSKLSPTESPSHEEVAAAYQLQRDRLRKPDRRNLSHVFFSGDRRKDHAVRDAGELRAVLLKSKLSPSQAIALGDPFPLGHQLRARSELDLQRSFGERFGQDVFSDPIERWSHPIASAYGQHLVWTSRIQIGQIPPLEAAAEKIRNELIRERKTRKLESYLRRARSRVQVEIESNQEQSPS